MRHRRATGVKGQRVFQSSGRLRRHVDVSVNNLATAQTVDGLIIASGKSKELVAMCIIMSHVQKLKESI